MKITVVGLATFSEMAGGSARYLSGMVDALRRSGHDVSVVTSGRQVSADRYVVPGLRGQIARTARRILFVQPFAAWAVVRRRPDVLNVHFAFDGFSAVIAARVMRVPIVVMFQGPWAKEAASTGLRGGWPLSSWVRRAIERFVYRSAARCVVLSTAFRELLIDEYGVARSRVEVIPPGFDATPFEPLIERATARSALGVRDRPTIVTVRRLVRRMGLDLLIEALARMDPSQRPQLLVAGAGPEAGPLERLAADRGVRDDVVFLGRVPDADLLAVYAAGDLCVVPSRELEGFGYVVLEAYAAGTPVLATAIGGLLDVVGDFDPGRLVEPDAGAIAAAVTRAFERPADLPQRAVCRTYARQFTWDRIEPRLRAVFDAVAR